MMSEMKPEKYFESQQSINKKRYDAFVPVASGDAGSKTTVQPVKNITALVIKNKKNFFMMNIKLKKNI